MSDKLFKQVNPIDRVGNTLIAPNWRYDCLYNPQKYKLKTFCSRTPRPHSASLRRFVSSQATYQVTYKMRNSIKNYYNRLDPVNKHNFQLIWETMFKKRKQKKLLVSTENMQFQKIPLWNMGMMHRITDKMLVTLIEHISNFRYNRHIAYALELGRNPSYTEIFRFIGYCIFAKIPDANIAKRWRIPIKHVEAIRLLFFDFSCFPEDRLAVLAYLRQLTMLGVYSETDFAYYKRVFELGELGLKAQTDFYSLTKAEKKLIEEYLGKSIVATALNLNFTIKSQKDALEYSQIVSTLASHQIKEVERSYLEAKIRNLDANTRRIEGDLSSSEIGMSTQDQEYMALLTEHSLRDDRHEYKTLDMLK